MQASAPVARISRQSFETPTPGPASRHRRHSANWRSPAPRNRGRYWYNLHLVLVVEQHARLASWPMLTGFRDAFLWIADRTGHAVGRLSVMLQSSPRGVAPSRTRHRWRSRCAIRTTSRICCDWDAVARHLIHPRAELAGVEEGRGEWSASSPSDPPTSGARAGRGGRG